MVLEILWQFMVDNFLMGKKVLGKWPVLTACFHRLFTILKSLPVLQAKRKANPKWTQESKMAQTQTYCSTLGVSEHSTLGNRCQHICPAANEYSLSTFVVCVGRSQTVSIQVHYCKNRAMPNLDQGQQCSWNNWDGSWGLWAILSGLYSSWGRRGKMEATLKGRAFTINHHCCQ